MIELNLAKSIYEKSLSSLLKTKNKTLIIGIDGPTASGKTILADNLKELIIKKKKCFIFRLDWTLIDRSPRLKDLKNLEQSQSSMPYESSLHMRLDIVESFLKNIRQLEYQKKRKKIELKKLYSRGNNGKINGFTSFTFNPDTVVILEGHYTLETRLSKFIDLNILLLGNSKELIRRKVNRVKDYRDGKDVENYYHKIDLPSFKNHLNNFLCSSDIIIDNTNFKKPIFKDFDFTLKWIKSENYQKVSIKKKNDYERYVDFAFSSSLQSKIIRDVVLKSIYEFINWDKKISEYLTISIDQINCDLTTEAKKIIEKLNKFFNKTAKFELIHTNAIYNIYKRKLPITLGVNIQVPKVKKTIQFLMEVKSKAIHFKTIWDGGLTNLQIFRELGKYNDHKNHKISFFKEKIGKPKKKFLVFSPASFLVPKFLKGENFNLVLTDHEEENISSIACLESLNKIGGIFIRRFSTLKELYFFKKILSRIGFDSIDVGNYLISSKTCNSTLKDKIRRFNKNWEISFLQDKFFNKTNISYDQIVENDRKYVKKFVKRNCKDFIYLDERLYNKKNIQSSNLIVLSKQISKMLSSKNRLMRKKISQFLLERFPNLKVRVKEYWKNISNLQEDQVNLSEILEIQPSILSEVYLWLNLRGEDSAILGANIYDITNNSSDCYAYLSASFNNKTPIVLQASLNAVGQKEVYNKILNHGYLKPRKGVNDFIDSSTNAAIRYFLDTGNYTFLYGVGLDHVNYENDFPPGRANRFLSAAIKTDLITHYVLDGSKKFFIKKNKDKLFNKAYDPVVNYALSLLDNIPPKEHYIHDKEICAGELNYSENNKSAIIPKPENFISFVDVFKKYVEKKKMYEIAKRPILFIGNLGTTHHSTDKSVPVVEKANDWKKMIQRFNFVSAVLHGTTNTHSDYLRKSTSGCHKVNVAGDLLDTLVKNLPVELYEKIQTSKQEKKKSLFLIKSNMENLSPKNRNKLIINLKHHCDMIQKNINSPKLTNHDISYFKYKPYKFNKIQISEILSSVKNQLDNDFNNLNKKNFTKRKSHFSASMIEVKFDNFYKKAVKAINNAGIKYFHIDVGDGDFITRKIDAINKVEYLKKYIKNIKIHCHLMVKNPHKYHKNFDNYIERYCEAGCDRIALHERSFKDLNELKVAINLVKKMVQSHEL